MIKEKICTGYLRTCCWSKIKHLFENMAVASFKAERSKQERGAKDEIHPWLYFWLTGKGKIVMDWDLNKDNVSWDIALRDFTELQNKYLFEDFVVEKIEIKIKNDDVLVDKINKFVKKKNINPLSIDVPLYFTYKNTPLASSKPDGVKADTINQINKIQIKELGFKRGIMDLKHMRAGTRVVPNLDFVLTDHDIIWHIIKKHINNERWFQNPEIKRLPKVTFPGSVRTYERGESIDWKVVKDEEIR